MYVDVFPMPVKFVELPQNMRLPMVSRHSQQQEFAPLATWA
jgi:hypothetical protein